MYDICQREIEEKFILGREESPIQISDDKGQSLLYNLKEWCHSLFRYSGKGPIQKNEWLLDLAIGSIFHAFPDQRGDLLCRPHRSFHAPLRVVRLAEHPGKVEAVLVIRIALAQVSSIVG
jgi:hypothetical protein